MAWLRLDDGFTKHPKFEGWTPAQRWAWLEVMEYCARYQTGGKVPTDLSLMPRGTTRGLLTKAVESGWLDVHDDGTRWVHDWQTYNPKDPTGALRQARHRASRNANVTDESRDSNAVTDRDETVPRARIPVPSRPEEQQPAPEPVRQPEDRGAGAGPANPGLGTLEPLAAIITSLIPKETTP